MILKDLVLAIALAAALAFMPSTARAQDTAQQLNALVAEADAATAAGRHHEAAKYLGQVLDLDLRDIERFEVRLMRANANLRAGEAKKAIGDWRGALDIGAATPEQEDAILHTIAQIWIELNDLQAAEATLAEWPVPSPKSEAIAIRIAEKWIRRGNESRAAQFILPLIEQGAPSHDALRVYLGLLLLDENYPEIEAAIARFPEQSANLLNDPDYDGEFAQPILVSYPGQAARSGREGSCTVYFDVSAKGRTQNISANCTDDAFSRRATNTVGEWLFLPKLVDGELAPRTRVDTEITYSLAN